MSSMSKGTGKPVAGKTGMIRARVDPKLKAKAERVFGQLGLSPSDAIRLFYTRVALSSGLPFEVRIPNALTAENP
jgi:DNA-damage-inducible protein J